MGVVKVRDVSEDELDFYREHGWVRLPAFVDKASVRALRAWIEHEFDSTDHTRVPASTFRFWPAPSEKGGPAREIAHSSDLARAARRLIGVTAVRQYFDAVLVKEPVADGGTDTRFHQDFSAQPFDMKGGLQFWFALGDIPSEMGTVRFLSRSRELGPLGMATNWPDDLQLPDVWPELKALELSEPFDLELGDATVHDSLTVHCAGENCSNESRWAMVVSHIRSDTRYNGARNVKTDPLGLIVGQEFDHPSFPLFSD